MDKGKESLIDVLGSHRSKLNRIRAVLMEQTIELNGMVTDIMLICESEVGHKPQEMTDAFGDEFTRCSICWKTWKP